MSPGRDVFLALAAVIWSDGKVTSEEAEAFLAAARAYGVAGEDLDAVTEATTSPGEMVSVTDLELDDDERVFVYGVAGLLARADGTVSTDETAMLRSLGELLGLTPDQRAAAAASDDVKAMAAHLRIR